MRALELILKGEVSFLERMVIMASYWLRGPFSAPSQIVSSFPLLCLWSSGEALKLLSSLILMCCFWVIVWFLGKGKKAYVLLCLFFFSFGKFTCSCLKADLFHPAQESSLWRWWEPHAWGELMDVWKKWAPCKFFLHRFDLSVFLCLSLPMSCPPLPPTLPFLSFLVLKKIPIHFKNTGIKYYIILVD